MTKKYIAPIIVSVCLVLYYTVLVLLFVRLDLPAFLLIAAVVFSFIVSALVIKVLIERIKEIRSGVEDDLGKY